MENHRLGCPSEHPCQNAMRNGLEIGARSDVVLDWPETLVGGQIALRDVRNDKAGPEVIFDHHVTDPWVRGNRQARNSTFQPAFESPRVLDLELGGGYIAERLIWATVDTPDDNPPFRVPEAGDRLPQIPAISIGQ